MARQIPGEPYTRLTIDEANEILEKGEGVAIDTVYSALAHGLPIGPKHSIVELLVGGILILLDDLDSAVTETHR